MKLSKTINDKLNKQLNQELSAQYSYIGMAAYFESISMNGMANWMLKQASEEQVHAMKIFEFIHQRDGSVKLDAIPAQPTTFKSVLDVFKQAYQKECGNTTSIHKLLEAATKEKDHATVAFLKWFVDEQVEEEDQAQTIVDRVTLVQNDKAGLLQIDSEMASRKE